jgi:uncharacterized protein (TIGR00369 family)
MLSWDDFRVVKTIAEHDSLADAARSLQINQSTLFAKLDEIEQRAGSQLFERKHDQAVATPQGKRAAQFAKRIEHQLAQFDPRDGKAIPAFETGLVPAEQVMARGGLEFLTDIIDGRAPQAPMCGTLGFRLAEASDGYAMFEGYPEFRHYNPIGTVHGGFAATLLDSALGCAIFSTMAKGEAWTTLELKMNLVRPISDRTGPVRAEGRIVHRGRTVATADGTVKDLAGKLYAHATTTCMVFPAKA